MKIRMNTIAAGPERILEMGKVYDLPKEVARPLVEGVDAVSGKHWAERVDSDTPAKKLPPQPDPHDHPEVKEDDDGWETGGDE